MKPVFYIIPVAFVLAACKRDETVNAPKAVEVDEQTVVVAEEAVIVPEEGAVPKAVIVPESSLHFPSGNSVAQGVGAEEGVVAPVPPIPRKRLAQVVDKVGQGLETAGQKTQEAAAVAEKRTEDALGIAREKTETGLRNAAGATGNFLKKAGEKIEEKAKEAEEP